MESALVDLFTGVPADVQYLVPIIRQATGAADALPRLEELAAVIRTQTGGLERDAAFALVFGHRDRLWDWFNGLSRPDRARVHGVYWVVGEMSATEPLFVEPA